MAKKSFENQFTENPALQFISKQQDIEPEDKSESNVPMKKNPEYIETKSRRVNLLMQPSLYESLSQAAAAQGISVNELIHNTMKEYIDKLR